MSESEIFTALAREAALVAEQMCTGATLVSKTNYARQGRYLQLFFSLSIAFERAAKLIIVVDHLIETGEQPNEKLYRPYQHNLKKLFTKVEELSGKFNINDFCKMPKTQIHNDIISILSEFASNVTRYYNLDVVAENKNPRDNEPISQWYQKVILPLFEERVSDKKKQKIIENAAEINAMMDGLALVSYTNENGEEMDNALDASYQTGVLEVTSPYVRLYVLQICRFLAAVLSKLGDLRFQRQLEDIPYMSDFFRVFYNKDSFLKSRKTWEVI